MDTGKNKTAIPQLTKNTKNTVVSKYSENKFGN